MPRPLIRIVAGLLFAGLVAIGLWQVLRSDASGGNAATGPKHGTRIGTSDPDEPSSDEQGGVVLPSPSQSSNDATVGASRPDTPLWSAAREAGVADASALRPSGSVTVKEPGTVVENLDISGTIVLKAPATVRNVRLRYGGNAFGIRVYDDAAGSTIENVHLIAHATCGPNGMIHGGPVVVRLARIEGCADGIKVHSGSTYEYNWISMSKPSTSDKHLDAMQNVGDDVIIRGNILDADADRGGNAAYIATDTAKSQPECAGSVLLQANLLSGGNYTVFAHQFNVEAIDNTFANDLDENGQPDHQYGRWSGTACSTLAGNTIFETREPVTTAQGSTD